MIDPRTSAAALHEFGTAALGAVGVPGADAAVVMDSLVDADMRGLDDHGAVARLPVYAQRLRQGGTVAAAQVEVVSDVGAVAVLDAAAGLGQVAAKRAVDLAVARARRHGVGVVSVTNSGHLGVLGYWTRLVARQGMIGHALSGATARIAPWGGYEPMLSTNPWSWAFPSGRLPPLVVDVSNSAVLPSVLAAAAKRDESLVPGIALDGAGRPTIDPAAAAHGSILPFGGAKGGAMTLALEVLSTVLTGAEPSTEVPNLGDGERPMGVGHLFIALRVDAFMADDVFTARIERFLDAVATAEPAEGFSEVRVPGARGERVMIERGRDGIPLSGRHQPLDDLAVALGVPRLTRLAQNVPSER